MSEAQPSPVGHDNQVTPAAIMQLGTALWGSTTLNEVVGLPATV
ncbi:MAG: hypothetical protein ACRDQ4_04380 [Pseudonocardiaceae bacterium]